MLDGKTQKDVTHVLQVSVYLSDVMPQEKDTIKDNTSASE